MNRFKRCLIAAAAAGFAVMLVAGCGVDLVSRTAVQLQERLQLTLSR